jgi:hypothetical protein
LIINIIINQKTNNHIIQLDETLSSKNTLYADIKKATGEKTKQINPYSNIGKKYFKADFKE